MKKMKIIREGFTQAMLNDEIHVNTTTDEIVKFVVRDKEIRNKMYCKITSSVSGI